MKIKRNLLSKALLCGALAVGSCFAAGMGAKALSVNADVGKVAESGVAAGKVATDITQLEALDGGATMLLRLTEKVRLETALTPVISLMQKNLFIVLPP